MLHFSPLRSNTPREFVKPVLFANAVPATVRVCDSAPRNRQRRGTHRCRRRPSNHLRTCTERRLHPLPVRVMHWINAVAIFIMIGSGWKIYNDDVIFGWLHFPDAVVIGKWAQYGLQWHFFGMWIFVLNGLAYLIYGIATGRFRRKLFPISPRELLATVGDALRFRLAPRRPHPLQRRTENSVSRHHSDRHPHRDLRPGVVEAGAVLRACFSVWQFPDHPAGAFPLHVRDRAVSASCTSRSRCWCRKASSPC